MIECTSIYGNKIMLPSSRLIFRPSVYAIIPHKGRILLIRSRHGRKYYLPGGGIEIGERIETALKREIKEEVGIEIMIERFAHVHEDFFYYDPTDEAFHSFLFYYYCQPITFDLLDNTCINDDDAESPQWVDMQAVYAHDFQSHGDTILRLLPS